MKKFILFTVLPILLLSSCNSSTPGSNPEPSKEVISLAFGSGVITQYHVGDSFISPIIIATYSDEATEDVSSLCSFNGFDSSKEAEDQIITVTYLNKSTTYTVNIVDYYLESISLSNKVTSFMVGDDFIKPTVTAYYSDSYTEDVTNKTTFSGYDMNVANTYTVTATYQEKTATYSITVKPLPTLVDIYLDNVVDEYTVGDSFVKPTVTAKYSNDTYSIVTSDTTFSGYNMNVAGTYTVKATYQNKSKTYAIAVSEEFVRKELDCGYLQMPLPKNHDEPFNLKTTLSADDSSWYNSSLKSSDEFPYDEYRFIYGKSYDDGPSGEKASPSFYSSTGKNPGGMKMDQNTKGFQTGEFTHTGAKLEIRIGISQVNNSGSGDNTGKDVFRIYYFNNKGTLLGQDNYKDGYINVQSAGNHLTIYKTDSYTSQIAYFEFRLINQAYKGNQRYNFGIDYVNLKSWERI